MPDRIYVNQPDSQDARAYAMKKSWERVMRLQYGGQLEARIGADLWGEHDLDMRGLHNEAFYHTGLIGTAQKTSDDVRQRFPTVGYETGSILIKDYTRLGIAHEMFPEDMEDVVEGFDFISGLVSELPDVLGDAEEEEHHFVYNNGETYTSGIFNTELFVDGSSSTLQLLGRPTYFTGGASNILYGAPSYALFNLIHQYGDNFINEEGRPEAVEVDMYVANDQNADLIELYYRSAFNVENGNTASENPLRGRPAPTVKRSKRQANTNDIWVFFKGWQMFMKERNKYRGRSESWTEGNAQFLKVVNQIRSRYGYYFINNRLCLLVKGA